MTSFDITLSEKEYSVTFLVRPVERNGKTIYEIWGEDMHWISLGQMNGSMSHFGLTEEFSEKKISGELIGKVSDAIDNFIKGII